MNNTTRKSFMFYLNWEEQIDLLNDEELRRMIKNLIRYHQGKEITLLTPMENMCWAGIQPDLDFNINRYENRMEAIDEHEDPNGLDSSDPNIENPESYIENPEDMTLDDEEEIEYEYSDDDIAEIGYYEWLADQNNSPDNI